MQTIDGKKPLWFTPKVLRGISLFIFIFLALAVTNFVSGVRGQDQYWYLSDVETLMNQGKQETNFRFPGMILRQQDGNPQTHFIHNGPLLTLVAFIGKSLDLPSFNSWKLNNFVLLIVSAVLVGLVTANLSSSVYGWGAFLLYLVTPINVWQTANLLQEIFLGFLSALLLFVLLKMHTNGLARFATPIVLFVAGLAHPFFLVAAALYFLYSVFHKKWFLVGICTLSCMLASVLLKSDLYPNSFQPDLASIVASATPGGSNMIWHLSDTLPALNVELFVEKFASAFHLQFFNFSMIPLTVVTNFGIACLLYLACFRSKQYSFFLITGALYYSTFFAMIVLMQNQPRYQLLVNPVAICAILLAARDIKWRRYQEYILAVGLLLILLCDLFLLKKINDDAQVEESLTQSFQANFDHYPPTIKVAFVSRDVQALVPLLASLRPRPSLMIDLDYLQPAKVGEALQLFDADVLVSSKLPDNYDIQPNDYREISVEPLAKRLFIYRPHGGRIATWGER